MRANPAVGELLGYNMGKDQGSLVSVYTTNNPALIAVVKSILDNAELNYFVQGEMAQLVWPHLPWVYFKVNPDDVAEAKEVLRTVTEEDPGENVS